MDKILSGIGNILIILLRSYIALVLLDDMTHILYSDVQRLGHMYRMPGNVVKLSVVWLRSSSWLSFELNRSDLIPYSPDRGLLKASNLSY